MELETIKVVSPVSDANPHGYVVINKSDLTEDHKVFREPKAAKPPKVQAAAEGDGAAAEADGPTDEPDLVDGH